MTYQNEYNRLDAIDTKFYYIFIIAAGLLAVLGLVLGGYTITQHWYVIIVFLLKLLILGQLDEHYSKQ
jgi:hypothetical protein